MTVRDHHVARTFFLGLFEARIVTRVKLLPASKADIESPRRYIVHGLGQEPTSPKTANPRSDKLQVPVEVWWSA